jgi:hypothetical protein
MSLILSGTDGLSDVDGSAATPAIRGTDANTGIFFPAADTIAFSEGGVESMRIDSSGNVGIGVTPSAWGGTSKALQLPAGSFESRGSTITTAQNAYFNGTNWIYSSTAGASLYAQNAGIHYFYNAASGTAGNTISFTQAMTLDASGNLGVGETSPTAKLHIGVASAAVNGTKGVRITNPAGTVVMLECGNGGDSFVGTTSGSDFNIRTGNVTRATFDNSGNLLVGKTSTSATVAGFLVESQGDTYITVEGVEGKVLYLNRLTSDGDIVQFAQANTTEGSISVSGTTVSYNGGHLSRWAQTTAPKDDTLVKGTVMSNLDEMNVYTDAEGNPVDNEQLNKVKVSDVQGDANVAGVFVNWTHDDAHDVDEINMAMTGDMIIRIAQGTTVARGDLLMSAGDGTAKPQGDDIVRSKTVAKVTSTHVTCTYPDGSFCVPCVLMAC